MAINHREVWRRYFGDDAERQDMREAFIDRSQYEKKTAYGWDVDHIIPVSRGGSDQLTNLRPMHYLNNKAKGDKLDHEGWKPRVVPKQTSNGGWLNYDKKTKRFL